MKKLILIGVALVFVVTMLSANTVLRWNYYSKYPVAKSHKVEIATNIDKVIDYNPSREYFEEVMITEYWRAGDFPFIKYTKIEENLGVFSRKK